jgi:hypothetical protein
MAPGTCNNLIDFYYDIIMGGRILKLAFITLLQHVLRFLLEYPKAEMKKKT